MKNILTVVLMSILLGLLAASCAAPREGCPMNSTPKTKFRR